MHWPSSVILLHSFYEVDKCEILRPGNPACDLLLGGARPDVCLANTR